MTLSIVRSANSKHDAGASHGRTFGSHCTKSQFAHEPLVARYPPLASAAPPDRAAFTSGRSHPAAERASVPRRTTQRRATRLRHGGGPRVAWQTGSGSSGRGYCCIFRERGGTVIGVGGAFGLFRSCVHTNPHPQHRRYSTASDGTSSTRPAFPQSGQNRAAMDELLEL
jgi:hypothetical protein